MGIRNLNKIALVATVSLVFGLLGVIPSQSSEPNEITLQLRNFDLSPNTAAVIAPTGIAQPSQSVNSNGETKWKLHSGTQSFNVQFKADSNPWTQTTSYLVSLGIKGDAGEVHTIDLPEIVRTLVPVSESENIGHSFKVTWMHASRNSQLMVDGVPKMVWGTMLPEVVSIIKIEDKSYIEVAYSKPSALSGPNPADVDGDSFPDLELSIASRFGKVSHRIVTSLGNSNQSEISLAEVPWVDFKVNNENLYLSVMYKGQDITEELSSGAFGSFGGRGFSNKGRFAEYQFVAKPYAIEGQLITFSINNVTLATSKPVNLKTKNVICAENSKGWTRQFQTLGKCPKEWTLTATLRKLSEKKYANCAAVNRFVPGGIARSGATNKGKRAFRTPLFHNAGYANNKHLDADRDGIACER